MTRIRVDHPESVERARVREVAALSGVGAIDDCRVSTIYVLERELSAQDTERVADELLVDPVVDVLGPADDSAHQPKRVDDGTEWVIEVARRPGVTDTVARELERGLAQIDIDAGEVVRVHRYELAGSIDRAEATVVAQSVLANETIEDWVFGRFEPSFGVDVEADAVVDEVPLAGLDGSALVELSTQRLLSLDQAEMTAIQDFFDDAGRAPTDAELETLAQTWSEHCVHKTFKSEIRFTHTDRGGDTQVSTIGGLMKEYLREVTDELWPTWLRSAFVDNAGIVEFDDDLDLSIKVETHNHPSALEPFGGANTGVGGVVRDIMGVSARPIAAIDILCFGPQDYPAEQLPDGVLHPARVAEGVIAGVGDYGNKLGLPTVAGAVLYDKGYLGNPLVFCGSIGIAPRDSHPTDPQVGDLIVALGGRTGRDGIHGATFSSAELAHDTAVVTGSAVQIGDPITEKGVLEMIEHARDAKLYTAITDCGAGGFSSAVGEMGEKLGAEVDLANVPLKYPGLRPWEIYLSEAQERMVLAVPPANLDAIHDLAERWQVEVSVLGSFTGDQRLRVRHGELPVVDLPMDFLHDGLPSRTMEAEWVEPAVPANFAGVTDLPALTVGSVEALLLTALADPNVASKEDIVRTYDHEVRGGTIVRPFCGPEADGPTDAAVCKPLGTWSHSKAFALGIGVNPRLGRVDPNAMALAAIDEAIRNVVAVGGDPDRIALIDNFCWGNPTIADRLGSLVRAAQGCAAGARAYRAPFISGKDSLFNEFEGTPIPGTLVITAMAIVDDIDKVATSDLKSAGNDLWLIGITQTALAGSLAAELLDTELPGLASLPVGVDDPVEFYRRMHAAINGGSVAAVHDLSEGGLAVALAEMCIAGRLGAEVSLEGVLADSDETTGESNPGQGDFTALFSESLRRFLVEVPSANRDDFAAMFADGEAQRIGSVSETPILRIEGGAGAYEWNVDDLVTAWSPKNRPPTDPAEESGQVDQSGRGGASR